MTSWSRLLREKAGASTQQSLVFVQLSWGYVWGWGLRDWTLLKAPFHPQLRKISAKLPNLDQEGNRGFWKQCLSLLCTVSQADRCQVVSAKDWPEHQEETAFVGAQQEGHSPMKWGREATALVQATGNHPRWIYISEKIWDQGSLLCVFDSAGLSPPLSPVCS